MNPAAGRKKGGIRMKKLIWLLLAALCLAFGAAAEEPAAYTSGDYEYVLHVDGSAEITAYTGDAAELEIPAALDGHAVTAIGPEAFYRRDSLAGVTIPNSVTTLTGNPFSYCERLTEIRVSPDHPALEVVDGVLFGRQDKRLICCPYALAGESYAIPRGTRIIGENAFFHCDSLLSVTVPDGVTEIGDQAFCSCWDLAGITLPEGVTTIGYQAFFQCFDLAAVTLPEGLTAIGDSAFDSCFSLAGITIPGSVTAIGESAFSVCDSLVSVTVPDGVTRIRDWTFFYCDSLTSVVLPDSVTQIGTNAFANCPSLAAVNLPAGVAAIGEEAFADCPLLTLTVTRGSYAERYCRDNGLAYAYAD